MIATRVNSERLLSRLATFSEIGATPLGGVNRPALGVADRQARRLLATLALQRGFEVFQDAAANVFIRRTGRNPFLPPFLVGSHLDSQPTGGRYDGALGSLAAFEVLETLEDSRIETDCSVEAVVWTNEEGCRFSPGAMGSQAFVLGGVCEEWLAAMDRDGHVLSDELCATISSLPEAAVRPLGLEISGYLELHIEQGPYLVKAGLSIGIVTGVQGTRWYAITIEGQAAHAGTTGPEFRRDPVSAFSSALTKLASVMTDDSSARITVGRITAEPGAVNVIPSRLTFSIDLRHPDLEVLNTLEKRVLSTLEEQAKKHGCRLGWHNSLSMAPAKFSPEIVATIELIARDCGLAARKLVSGAFHDALYLSRVAPAGMIFVPCRDGLSHNEAEYVTPENAVNGCQALLQTTLRLVQAEPTRKQT